MLTDLFSQFDPSASVLFKYSSLLFWGANFFFVYSLSFLFFDSQDGEKSLSTDWAKSRMRSVSVLGLSLGATGANSRGFLIFLLSILYMLTLVNLLGWLPGTFSVTSQFIFSMSLAVPLWLSLLMLTFMSNPVMKFSSYIGTGIPMALSPFIGICEVISALMRPLALGLRLGANMLAGHVITSLVANCFIYAIHSFSISAFVFGLISTGLAFFELGVCLIQAYVFVLLLRVYFAENIS